MAYGRIRRDRAKIFRAGAKNVRGTGILSLNAKAKIWRDGSRYRAQACIGKAVDTRAISRASCGRTARGRTPQSAIAKAFRQLARRLAVRGRRQ